MFASVNMALPKPSGGTGGPTTNVAVPVGVSVLSSHLIQPFMLAGETLIADVPALMPITLDRNMKAAVATSHGHPSGNFHGGKNDVLGGGSWFAIGSPGQNPDGRKGAKDGLGGYGGNFGWNNTPMRRGNSKSAGRKMASAMIAKIPLPLSRHIGATFR